MNKQEIEARIKMLELELVAEKTKQDSLKLTINGSFGKFGSPYSMLYSPKLMIQTTVTGQLSLLMLIEALESRGIPVASANTDGIVVRCPIGRQDALLYTIKEWEQKTGFNMERSNYTDIYSRDVNNYLAVKVDGKVKTKGCFSLPSLAKNPANEICNMALTAYLINGTPFLETITGCQDITKFISLRKVNGGAVKGATYLGKTVRWYQAKGERGSINYKDNGKLVAKTTGAMPCMELPDTFPGNIDHDWYVRECEGLLYDIGVKFKGQSTLFD